MNKKDKGIILNAIRLSFRKSDIFKDALRLSIHPTIKGVRGGKLYECRACKKCFKANEIQIDHIVGVVPKFTKRLDMSIQDYAERLFCNIANLQPLCKACHLEKTKKERKH